MWFAVLTAYFAGSGWALPSDFAGLKLGQGIEETKHFLLEKGHNIIFPDGVIIWSNGKKQEKVPSVKSILLSESKAGKLCTVNDEKLVAKSEFPYVKTFDCGVTAGKSTDLDRVIDTYVVRHLFESGSGSGKAYHLEIFFNMKTHKPAGRGIIGKLGEPDSLNTDQPCPQFIREALKMSKPDNSCFIAMWLPEGAQIMATVVGYGNKMLTAKIGRLELWDMEAQKKVESFKSKKAANDLGF
ncbi:MAG: hypothetical protein AB7F86_17755 [Bdellovibrionales bacterium]